MAPRPIAMIADDDRATRGVLADVLGFLGFEVQGFEDGDLLARAVAAAVPDLIVTDQHMARWNGTRALGQIRTDGATCPAILLTAFPDEALVAQATLLAPCEVLGKPVDVLVLRSCIDRLTDPGRGGG